MTKIIRGTKDSDQIETTSDEEKIFGLGGDDILINDLFQFVELYGGSGDDILKLGLEGFEFFEHVSLFGGLGDDFLLGKGAEHDVVFGGGKGDDRFVASESSTARGGAGDDLIYGGGETSGHMGGRGDDIFIGGYTDGFDGGRGHDVIVTESEALGGRGNDLIFHEGDTNGPMRGGAGADVMISAQEVVAQGDEGNDIMVGSPGELDGGRGDDTLFSSTIGAATPPAAGLTGTPLTGGGGDDLLVGAMGDDTFSGNAGRDTFFLAPGMGSDEITDIDVQSDRVNLSPLFDFSDPNEFLGCAVQTEFGAMLDFGAGDQLLFRNLATDQLASVNFVLDNAQPVAVALDQLGAALTGGSARLAAHAEDIEFMTSQLGFALETELPLALVPLAELREHLIGTPEEPVAGATLPLEGVHTADEWLLV